MSDQPKRTLFTMVKREPFTDFFRIHVPDGKGGWHFLEELDFNDTVEWFTLRGAIMDDGSDLDKALTHVWNFYQGTFTIKDFRDPPVKNAKMKAQID